MPMARALRLCPHAIVVGGRMGVYSEVSAQVMGILDDFSPAVEPVSIDEAFVEMTGAERIFDLLDEQPEIQEKDDAIEMPSIVGQVIFDNAWLNTGLY